MTGQLPWRPTRRRLTDTLVAAVAPVAACGLALGGLSLWTAYGNAGTPASIKVTDGRMFAPTGSTPDTAAYFRIANSGGAPDRLLKVTTAGTGDRGPTLSRHVMTSSNTASDRTVSSVGVPAGTSLAMSPASLGVIVPVRKGGWRTGDLVAFTLHFERGGAVKTLAVVVRPGQDRG
ncbi:MULTISPECIES: copper chaperone PCu(A)C [Streptomyces]|uniref:Copper chaperone PCu(A)C n=1 Tax=Streptomyces koelreuteriae TaxID=2838015 RepID=A0ABX8FJB9_9ACTN|nr:MULTISPECIES: copper chaperone PCu(A)C [Streptomyces]QWB21212.1 copper chaperone PCu(A)C [Streptomyces koelreuteriae]UUA04129.1 copper chaperone PCu(A)C [Streptomyces koelreuteriae]UUA11755.1 copper chaperone PCu(A)C [Streptomyces sp. CRCS-T-1]